MSRRVYEQTTERPLFEFENCMFFEYLFTSHNPLSLPVPPEGQEEISPRKETYHKVCSYYASHSSSLPLTDAPPARLDFNPQCSIRRT